MQQRTQIFQEIDDAEEVISASEIKEMLGMWENLSNFIQKKHPEKVVAGRATVLFIGTCLTHSRKNHKDG